MPFCFTLLASENHGRTFALVGHYLFDELPAEVKEEVRRRNIMQHSWAVHLADGRLGKCVRLVDKGGRPLPRP